MRSHAIAIIVLFLVTTLAGGPAFAASGYYYEAETSVTVDDKKPDVTTVYTWIAGEDARIEFVEGPKKGLFSKGSYLLTTDGGRTIKLVDTKEETWSEIDVEAMMNLASSLMASMDGMGSITFEDGYSELLVEESGGAMLGHDTTHKQWKSGVKMKMKMMGFKNESQVDTLQDIWFTDELEDPMFTAWLRPASFRTGNDEMDEMLRGEFDKMTGFPLKSVTVTTTTGKKGKQSTSTSETLVRELRKENVDDERFTVPEHYEHQPIMLDEEQLRAAQADAEQQQAQPAEGDQAQADDAEPDSSFKDAKKKFTGLFKKKKKKKDD